MRHLVVLRSRRARLTLGPPSQSDLYNTYNPYIFSYNSCMITNILCILLNIHVSLLLHELFCTKIRLASHKFYILRLCNTVILIWGLKVLAKHFNFTS